MFDSVEHLERFLEFRASIEYSHLFQKCRLFHLAEIAKSLSLTLHVQMQPDAPCQMKWQLLDSAFLLKCALINFKFRMKKTFVFFHSGGIMVKRFPIIWISIPIKPGSFDIHAEKLCRLIQNHFESWALFRFRKIWQIQINLKSRIIPYFSNELHHRQSNVSLRAIIWIDRLELGCTQ